MNNTLLHAAFRRGFFGHHDRVTALLLCRTEKLHAGRAWPRQVRLQVCALQLEERVAVRLAVAVARQPQAVGRLRAFSRKCGARICQFAPMLQLCSLSCIAVA